jgi:solute carrier family 25 (mitochondrial phosphate transporter), member 23/24/25/41
VPMPSVEIVTSSYELVRSGGLAALWYALKRTFGSVGDGVQVALMQSTTAKFLLSGAVAGIVSRTAVSPLEVVATSQMVRGGDKHMVQELSHLFQTEGVRGFFKGNAANCLKVAPTRGVQFFAFEALKKRLVEYKRKRTGNPAATLAPGERLIAGGFAGMIASSLVYPLEPVKTMLTMYPGKYSGIGAAFSGIFRQAGIGGLYKGLKPTLIAMFPYVGVEFMIYETSKIAVEALLARRAAANGGRAGRHDGTIAVAVPVVVSLGLGALAGAAAQTSAHPLDVVRKRLQVQGLNGNPVLYKNAMDCFSKVAKNEGVAALYKGLGPACVATIPGTGIAYITYEAMKRFLKLESV